MVAVEERDGRLRERSRIVLMAARGMTNGGMAVFHGIHRLGRYNPGGRLLDTPGEAEAAVGGGTKKRTFHLLQEPDTLFAPDSSRHLESFPIRK